MKMKLLNAAKKLFQAILYMKLEKHDELIIPTRKRKTFFTKTCNLFFNQ